MGALFLFGLDFAFIVAAPAPRRRAKIGFAGTPVPTSSEAWEIFQVKIRAAGAATQLVEYETGIEIDSVFFQKRKIFFFKGHLPIDVPSGNGCTSPRPGDSIRSRQMLHRQQRSASRHKFFRSVAGGLRPGIQPQRTRRTTKLNFRWNGWDIKCQ
jgi:hypothetical protein